MPTNDPQFGEVWGTQDAGSGRPATAFIADVSPTRVMLVSMTGNRVAVAPQRLHAGWRFIQGAPQRDLPQCSREGCGNAGVLQYTTQGRANTIVACPRHVPMGVQSVLTNSSIAITEVIVAPACPTCGNEDPFENVSFSFLPRRMWVCPSCNVRFVGIPVHRGDFWEEIEQTRNYLRASNLGVEIEAVLVPESEWGVVVLAAGRLDTLGFYQGLNYLLYPHTQGAANFAAVLRLRVPLRSRGVQRIGGAPIPPTRAGVLAANFNQLYGPSPDALARADTLRRVVDEARTPPRVRPPQGPPTLPTIANKSRWVQRTSGDIVEVQDVVKATDGSDIIVFRRVLAEEDVEPAVRLTLEDFLTLHRAYDEETAERAQWRVEVSVGEEWESKDGSSILVTSVDARKETVYGEDLVSHRQRQLPFVQFAVGQWRKIVRRSAYDRLRKPEVGE